MRKSFLKVTILSFLLIFTITFTAFAVPWLNTDMAFAFTTQEQENDFFTGYSEEMSDYELHNATKLPSYSSDAPSITVLVHGQGGDASHWSNDGVSNPCKNDGDGLSFAKREGSMIDELTKRAGVANQYWALFTSGNNFTLYDLHGLTDYEVVDEDGYIVPNPSLSIIPKIEDVSKHTIIVFQSADPEALHVTVYEELHTLIDKVSYDYLVLTGKLPTINLVSHSRGGLTSMMYATGYKEGSKTANVEYKKEEELSNLTYLGKNSYGQDRYQTNDGVYIDVGDGIYEKEKSYNSGALIHDHPFNVSELYSMGTPYIGTDWDTKFFGAAHMLVIGYVCLPQREKHYGRSYSV